MVPLLDVQLDVDGRAHLFSGSGRELGLAVAWLKSDLANSASYTSLGVTVYPSRILVAWSGLVADSDHFGTLNVGRGVRDVWDVCEEGRQTITKT